MPEINNVWGQADRTEFLTLPSGQTCYARKLGVEEVLAAGLSAELDIMTSFVVGEHLVQGHNKSKEQLQKEQQMQVDKALKDPAMISKLIMFIDRLIPEIVTQPSVKCHYIVLADGKSTKMIPSEDREEGFIYTDKIDLDDKMFLFGWTTGTVTDPITFREGSVDTVADLANGQRVQRTGSRNSRRRRS
jgi:hypothetical protein